MISVLLIVVMAVLLIAAHKEGIKANQYNKVLGGVCSGIAQYAKMNPPLVRALTVLFILVTGGFAILLYILLWATLPKE
jgi:phage shock protein PspC (stress-responsive transcriptional regulator)